MGNKLLHKKILISSFVMLIISIAGLILGINSTEEYFIAAPGVLLIFSIFLIISSLAMKYNDVSWLTKLA
jgi:hypothetical protein